jgi:hypothetical protein
MGKLSPESYARMDEKRRELHAKLDGLVLDALARLGNSFEGRTMDLRKHITEALKESQIKDTILRLVKAGRLRITGNDNSRKRYEVVK